MSTLSEIATAAIEREWSTDRRWAGLERPYSAADVVRLRGSVRVEHSLARRGAERLWTLLQREEYVSAIGALTGAQATEMVKSGRKAISLAGRPPAAGANLSEQVHPDQSLYAENSGPSVVRHINSALRRADQIDWSECVAHDCAPTRDWMVPIVADADAALGGALDAFELMRSMIEAGAAGVQFEDQLPADQKRGHMGATVLIPTGQHVRTLTAARLAADVAGVPTLVIARTGASGAHLLTTDVDPRDQEFLTGERSPEGFYYVTPGIEMAVARALAYAPYADLIACVAATPDLDQARSFAEGVHAQYPGKLLAYNCSPSRGWQRDLDDRAVAGFQSELAAMGYAFQSVSLTGSHDLTESIGAGYFDDVAATVSSGMGSHLAQVGSAAAGRL